MRRLATSLAIVIAGCSVPPRAVVPSAPTPRELRFQAYDVYCPVESGPAPYVLVGLDDGQRRADARALAHLLAAQGFGVIVPDVPDPGAMRGYVQTYVPPPSCSQPAAWSGMGLGAGASRVAQALSEARSLVLVDATGQGTIEGSPCNARTEAAGCALCAPRVLILDSESGPCRGAPSGERLMQASLAGHARVRAVLRNAHGCETEGALLRDCTGPCERTERLRSYVIAWLTASGRSDAPSPPLDDVASYQARLRNTPAPSSVQFNASTVAGSEYYEPSGWGGALGFRPEFLFLRNSSRALGVGPYAELGLASGKQIAGTGVSLLVPVRGQLSIVPSLGAYARSRGEDGWQSGAVGGVFVGNRTYNEHTHAEFAVGLRADARAPFRGAGRIGYSIQLQFDLFNLGWLGFL